MKRQTTPHNLLLKVNLNARNADAHHAAEIVSWWRAQRAAAVNVVKAIRMFYALSQGDTTLLREYFPGLSMGVVITPPAPKMHTNGNGHGAPDVDQDAPTKAAAELIDDLFAAF